LNTPRGSGGYSTDRGTLPGAMSAPHDRTNSRSADTATHCAANGATT